MKAKIAVATVSGKAYYLIVNELKGKNMPFLSLTPDQPIPIEIKVVITTEEEQHLINHERILTYRDGVEPEALIHEALQIVQGKESYEKIVIGVDPGEVFGLAVLADGRVIETENCFSPKGTLDKIMSVLKNVGKTPITSVSVKVGDGVPACKEKLLRILDEALPSNVMLESVSEAGTNRYLSRTKHRRGLRDIVSAIRIAGRNGHPFQRRNTHESHG
jgi:predicted RNase H-like nuclease (RuvC/YqgF family)